MNRFVITLDVEDRELINELANRDEKMERVREQLMAKSEQSWNSDESDTFLISLPNLERYLSIVHNVYITQA